MSNLKKIMIGTEVLVWNHLDELNVWFKEPMKATETVTTSEIFHNDSRTWIENYAVYCKGYNRPINLSFVEEKKTN